MQEWLAAGRIGQLSEGCPSLRAQRRSDPDCQRGTELLRRFASPPQRKWLMLTAFLTPASKFGRENRVWIVRGFGTGESSHASAPCEFVRLADRCAHPERLRFALRLSARLPSRPVRPPVHCRSVLRSATARLLAAARAAYLWTAARPAARAVGIAASGLRSAARSAGSTTAGAAAFLNAGGLRISPAATGGGPAPFARRHAEPYRRLPAGSRGRLLSSVRALRPCKNTRFRAIIYLANHVDMW